MRIPNFTKKVIAIGAATGLALGVAGLAAAFFLTNGTATSSATAGTTSGASVKDWTVTFSGSPTYTGATGYTGSAPTAIYAGGHETIGYTIKNIAPGYEGLTAVTVALTKTTTGGTEMVAKTTGAAIAGCKWAWWGIAHTAPAFPDDLAPEASATGTITVTLNNTATTQDACETAHPAFKLVAGA